MEYRANKELKGIVIINIFDGNQIFENLSKFSKAIEFHSVSSQYTRIIERSLRISIVLHLYIYTPFNIICFVQKKSFSIRAWNTYNIHIKLI